MTPQGLMLVYVICGVVGLLLLIRFLAWVFGVRIIGNTEVGIVEKKWGGAPLKNQIIALNGEPGFQPDVLRGGVHFLPGYMYNVHKVPLVTIHRGQIGYVFARDGQPLGKYTQEDGNTISESGQTLGHVVAGGSFTNVREFLKQCGQQGMQRAILREGTYAINLAQFIVISSAKEIYYLPLGNKQEDATIQRIAQEINDQKGFSPVIIDGADDRIGIVTVHDGPSLPQGDIIAPTVGDSRSDPNYHNNFQDPQAFLSAGGYRGRQFQVLSEGTYWINRLFATVELVPKTHVPVGFVGVVVSFFGERGIDVSGENFKHGELCKKGGRGIWDEALLPGKYAFNTYAGEVIMVPTTNIILKWNALENSEHKLDTSLREIGLITKDAFEPELPLSVVINIDYRRAPHVIQRFGSVKNLIEQSLDPLVSSYFKNQGQQRTLIQLIQDRSEIQEVSTREMKERFAEYDLGLQEVLIGTPHGRVGDQQIETILHQLRERQVALEQIETYQKQQEAQTGLRALNEAEAVAKKQPELTNSKVQIEIEANQGEAAARRAEMQAKQTVTQAKAEAERTVLLADAEARRTVTLATAESESKARVQIAEAVGIREVRKAYGSPALMVKRELAGKLADAIANIKQPIVPRNVVTLGGKGEQDAQGDQSLLSSLMTLLLSDKGGLTDLDKADEDDELGATAKAFREKVFSSAVVNDADNKSDDVSVSALIQEELSRAPNGKNRS